MVDQTPQEAKRYQAMKNRLFLFNIILSFLFLLLFMLTGLSQGLRSGLAQLGFLNGFALFNGVYFACFVALAFMLSFPLDYYEGFVIEHKFGLSTQGFKAWVKDHIKKAAVSFVVSLILVEAVYYFLLKSSQMWWLWAAIFWFTISIVLTRIAPKVLLPLFFKYWPLPSGTLRDKVTEFLGRFKIAAKGVYVLDFSKKTVKANAMVSGLGATKRIFFSDTMVKEFSDEEIVAVLAHEVGHYLKGDTFKLSLWNLCSGLFSCFVASLCLGRLFPVFGLGAISDIAGLPLFAAVLMATGLLLLPLQNWFSRHLEKKADIFALEATKDRDSFISMMRKLANRNFSEFSPSKAVEIFLYDHPPIAQRIRLAETLDLGEQDRRQYKRLEHIFPVEFRFLDAAGSPVSEWYQAFTQDISRGGICLIVNNIQFGDAKYLADKDTKIELNINIPLGADAVKASARLAWFKTTRTEPSLQYVIGVIYDKIDARGNERILKYINARKFIKALAITFTLLLSAALVWAGFYNAKLRYANEKLLMSLSANIAQQRMLRQGSESLKSQIEETEFLLSQSERKTEILERRLLEVSQDDGETIAKLKGAIDLFKKYQDKIREDLSGLVAKKVKVDGDVTVKTQEASLLERKILDKLYRWLLLHQNNNTGLVASFEGDKDVTDWGFTYDQALAVMAFAKAGDLENARSILEFYNRAQRDASGGFANAYYASNGEISEYVSHAGPNIWLGLAVLQYSRQTKDMRYMGIAREIAQWLETIKDAEGGLKGGNAFSWYSTEHNLDAYAFYKMMNEFTKEETYKKRASETLAWLNKNAYSKIATPAVKRGKGDATIATDTYAWSITAVGPQALKGLGMDPDAIMDFALIQCSVSVDFKKPDGPSINVKGFDFAKHQNLARGGVISCEWTAQMILALKIMADYHQGIGNEEKALYYGRLGDEYTSELSKMIVSSPSPVGQGDFCLPYASHEFADTGHGWRTPKGTRTGSVAATAYTVLAIDGFNPLRFPASSDRVNAD